jgi:hypothetical protein
MQSEELKNLPAITPTGEHYVPTWSTEEVRTLAQIIASGLDLLRRSRVDAV